MFNCSHSLTCLYCNRVDHSKHTEIYKQCQREGKIELVFFNINKLLILFSVWKKTNQRFQSQDTHSSHFPHISHISSHVLIKFLIQIFYSICIKKNLLELEFPFFYVLNRKLNMQSYNSELCHSFWISGKKYASYTVYR